jgi:hypothetical protein
MSLELQAFLVLILVGAAMIGWLAWRTKKLRQADALAATSQHGGAGTATGYTTRQDAPGVELAHQPSRVDASTLSDAQDAPDDAPPVVASVLRHPRDRKHTAIAGATGDGKTTTVNTMLVWDIAAGARCVVLSTHYTPYHAEDQQIDLRPLQQHFEVAYTPQTIRAAMVAAVAEIDRRMTLYRDNQDVGQDVCLYLGEWGAIRRALGSDADDVLMKVLDEGRKTRVWVAGIELHSALINRLGGDSGMREAFKTRLVGNVDDTTWRVFVGRNVPKTPVPPRHWMTDQGLVEVVRPTADQIGYLAQKLPPITPLLTTITTPDQDPAPAAEPATDGPPQWTADHVKIAAILAAEPTIAARDLARRLWPAAEKSNGGGSYLVKAKKLIGEVQGLTGTVVQGGTEAENSADDACTTVPAAA